MKRRGTNVVEKTVLDTTSNESDYEDVEEPSHDVDDSDYSEADEDMDDAVIGELYDKRDKSSGDPFAVDEGRKKSLNDVVIHGMYGDNDDVEDSDDEFDFDSSSTSEESEEEPLFITGGPDVLERVSRLAQSSSGVYTAPSKTSTVGTGKVKVSDTTAQSRVPTIATDITAAKVPTKPSVAVPTKPSVAVPTKQEQPVRVQSTVPTKPSVAVPTKQEQPVKHDYSRPARTSATSSERDVSRNLPVPSRVSVRKPRVSARKSYQVNPPPCPGTSEECEMVPNPSEIATSRVDTPTTTIGQPFGLSIDKLRQSSGRGGYTKRELEQFMNQYGLKYRSNESKAELANRLLAIV